MAVPTLPNSNSNPRDRWRWHGLANPRDEFWPQVGVRIAIAGGVYPLLIGLLALIPITYYLLVDLFRGTQELGIVFLLSLAYPLFAVPFLFGLGFIYTAIVCSFTVPSLALTLKLLGDEPPLDRVGVFTGSLVAFLTTSPLWLYLSSNYSSTTDWFGLLLSYGLLTLALVLGQVAGLQGSIADARRRRSNRLHRTPFRLTLWRLMAAMIPLSLTLSLLRRAELLTLPTALAMLAAGVTAYLASWPVAWLFHRWADRRLRRRQEKRLAAGVPRETTATGDAA
ncbi:hypothetical protein MalM25_05580 [Planctomycetes bacterium MalM25]|nr:hypothetical protein MalM25_05580 [Planctomycetes bacterium MalM25]